MKYVYEFLGVNLFGVVCFIGGWIVGPRVISPIVSKLLAKIGVNVGTTPPTVPPAK